MSYDVLCFSHLRWDFVFQRPQHLMTRFSRDHRVFYFEEPKPTTGVARVEVSTAPTGVRVVVPYVPESAMGDPNRLRSILDRLIQAYDIRNYVAWYYTPMALTFSDHLRPAAVVYDCMDELAAFAFAPAELELAEARLFQRADVVFTGGQSLYEAKRARHPRVHAFPSSVDLDHFARARLRGPDPNDQRSIPGPRIGFFGVIDERMDIDLIGELAQRRPDWSFIFLGPVVKIDAATLPHRANIHYLGMKRYVDLPRYLSGWDVAAMPFACNAATRYISPTKTLEYLAGGKPVVATPVRDVEIPYGQLGLVRIGSRAAEIEQHIAEILRASNRDWLAKVDAFLRNTSWDRTWSRMCALTERAVAARAIDRVESLVREAPAARETLTVYGKDVKTAS